jgi:DeoR/GlpR family transcriptional regulator of sugar metabolism
MYDSIMGMEDRYSEIVETLQRDGRVDVSHLAEAFGTSEVTVRRDLDHLAEAGVLRRVRGGAVSLMMRGEELPFAMRGVTASAAKDRIGSAVAGLVRDGEAVVLDSGTTGLAAARSLTGRRLTVMPLSLRAAVVLGDSPSINLLLPGGTVRFGEQTLVGPLAEASLAGLRFDTAILTCCGSSPEIGVTAYDLQDAAVKRAAIMAATRTILIMDSSKFSRTAMAVVCPVTALDIIVTDTGAPATTVATLRDAGIEVHCV